MDASDGRASTRGAGRRPAERKEASRPRGEPGSGTGQAAPRHAEGTRRRRGFERRYTGWNDGVERAYCRRMMKLLPPGFPVESLPGVATIPATIVARRPDAILLCVFDHAGAHVWPDGETVDEDGETASRQDGKSASR